LNVPEAGRVPIQARLKSRDDIFTEDTLAWAAAMDARWDEARAHIAKAE
jgi:hypothetical protein